MATLAELLQTLPESVQARGRAFERVCQWYLLHSPLYAAQLQRVWLWADWPDRWGADAGIDLVAETHSGELWAVQAKAYAPETSITKASVDSFLSESARAVFSFRLLLGTTDAIGHNARQAFHGQQIPAALRLLGDLAAEPLQWPASIDDLRAPARAPALPRPHQAEALAAIAHGLAAGGRGRVIMACGTGKTFVQLWAHEQLRSSRTLVLVPSLFLVQQSLQEWTANRTRPFALLAVCSDETVLDSDSFTADVTALGVPVTTDALRIREFLAGPGDRVVFCTYQSSARVAEAMQGEPLRFELVLCDEAHQLAGTAAREFATALRAEAIPADRRIFFTATPRYFTGALQGSGAERDLAVASMDDAAVFGPELHRLSFGEAIRRELLSDYRVVVLGVTDREALQLAQQGAYMDFAEGTTDARSLGREIGLARAMKTYDLHRVISFHSRVQAAKDFAAHLPKVIAALPKARAPRGRLLFDYISGQMPTGERRTRLNRFRTIGADEYALLANARCLSEGVDVPAIDGVAFIDPRRSQVDIIQAVGRAIRLSAQKALGTIVIPVFVPEGADAQAVLAGSAFEPVWAVVRALRDHDEDLAGELDGLRRKLGREGKLTSKQLPKKIVLDVRGMAVSAAFLDAFTTSVVERATSSWEQGFAHLEEFVAREGHARVLRGFKSANGFALDAWVGTQRGDNNRGKLNLGRRRRLEALPGWSWDPLAEQWEEGFAELLVFVKRVGHARPADFTTEGGFRLGGWVHNQRNAHRSGIMGAERSLRLEALNGWVWDPHDETWETGMNSLLTFGAREGTTRVPAAFRSAEGFKLGAWVIRQRTLFAKRKLSPDRSVRLENQPGWSWNARAERWEDGFAHIQVFVEVKGNAQVPADFVTSNGYRLGRWVTKQRTNYIAGTLSSDRVTRLMTLPGWVWDPFISQWETAFELLALFAGREKHTLVPDDYFSKDGFQLGSWVSHQRSRYRSHKLPATYIARLEGLVGWAWNAIADQWELGFGKLSVYVSREGNSQVPQSHKTADGYMLGSWCNRQRARFRKGLLEADRQLRLEALSGWEWDPISAKWETGFVLLQKWVKQYGHARVTQSYKTPDGYRLGTWLNWQRFAYSSGTLDVQRTARLEALPGWSWDPILDQWEKGFDRLLQYVTKENSALVPRKFKSQDGFRLGAWVTNQRSRKRSLGADRIMRLEEQPGWVWDQIVQQWESGYAHVLAFASREGHSSVLRSMKTADGFTIGSWVRVQRRQYHKGKMSAERIARLEALPGWVWKAAN